MSDIVVLARVPCPRSDCVSGVVYAPMLQSALDPPQPRERDCEKCGGKGYVEGWRDLAELVGEVVRFGP